MMETSLSIIIPIYRIENEDTFSFFNKLVVSIQDNFSGEFPLDHLREIIVVNDYPEIDSQNKVSRLFEDANMSEKLVYIKLERNRGQAFARNAGAKKAGGDYLHFVDQDDHIGPDFYRKLLAVKKKRDVLMGNIFIQSETSAPYPYLKKHTVRIYEGARNLHQLRYFLISNIAVSPGQYLISKNAFMSSGGFPDLSNKGSDDFGMMYQLSTQKHSFLFDKEAMFFYRLHKDQSRNSLSIKNSVSEFFKGFKDQPSLSFKVISMVKKCSFRFPLIGKCFFSLFFNRN